MKKLLIIGLLMCLLVSGCEYLRIGCPQEVIQDCNNPCLRIQFFTEDEGRALFKDDLFIGYIEELRDYAFPTESDVMVCEDRDSITGECHNFLYRIALNGKC